MPGVTYVTGFEQGSLYYSPTDPSLTCRRSNGI